MAFPTTSVLDSFTRANESPLSGGGNWAAISTAADPLELNSNKVRCSVTGLDISYWTPTNFGPDCEVFATLSTVPVAAGGMRLYLRIQGEGGSNTFDGYMLRTIWVTGGANDTVTLSVVTNAAATLLATFTHEMVNGDKFGLTAVGTVLEAWCAPVATGVWGSLGTYDTASDGTKYSAAGKIALGLATAQTVLADDFGGGTYVPVSGDKTVAGVQAASTATA